MWRTSLFIPKAINHDAEGCGCLGPLLARAVVQSDWWERLELVANCRAVNVSYPSIPHSKRSFAYRPDLGIPNGKADGLHLGIEKLRLKV